MPISPEESLAVFGNSNHLQGFLADYEKAIKDNEEFAKPLTHAPHYYAWIRTAAEQVYYRIREMLYVNREDEKVFDWEYKTLLDTLFGSHALSAEQQESIVLFAKMRQLLVHKGFPNPHASPSENSRDISRGRSFTPAQVQELAEYLRNPGVFHDLQAKYVIAMRAIGACEREFTQNFGSFSISKKKTAAAT